MKKKFIVTKEDLKRVRKEAPERISCIKEFEKKMDKQQRVTPEKLKLQITI